MRPVRIAIGKLLAAALLTLCVGAQILEASGRWDRTFDDAGDEAIIVVLVLCVGAALIATAIARDRLTPSPIHVATVIVSPPLWRVFVASFHQAATTSPPLRLRI
jgi:hypothetical protein